MRTERVWEESGRRVQCPNQIAAPTQNLDAIATALAGVDVAGTGRFDQGLAWAWRMVSPRWRGLWGPENYPRPSGDVRKVVVYIGDGYATINWPFDKGGFNEHASLPLATSWNRMSQGHADHVVEVCRKMRAQGIQLFMMAPNDTYHVMDAAMQACAVDGSRYFHVTNADAFRGALAEIVATLTSEVRLID